MFEDFLKDYITKVVKSIRATELITKSAVNFDTKINEQGIEIIEKVPAGYIAYNTADGRMLVGGKFWGVPRVAFEEGETDWVLVPAQKPSEQEQKELSGHIRNLIGKKELSKEELEKLGKYLLSALEKRKAEEGKIEDILGAQLAPKIKPLLETAKQHGIGTKKELQAVKKVEEKLTSPPEPHSKDYYVFDKKKKLLASLDTYLNYKDKFSDDIVIFGDPLTKLRPSLGIQEGISPRDTTRILTQVLGLDMSEGEANEYSGFLATLLDWLRGSATRYFGRSVPGNVLRAIREITGEGSIKIPLSAFDLPSGVIYQLSDDLLEYFTVPTQEQFAELTKKLKVGGQRVLFELFDDKKEIQKLLNSFQLLGKTQFGSTIFRVGRHLIGLLAPRDGAIASNKEIYDYQPQPEEYVPFEVNEEEEGKRRENAEKVSRALNTMTLFHNKLFQRIRLFFKDEKGKFYRDFDSIKEQLIKFGDMLKDAILNGRYISLKGIDVNETVSPQILQRLKERLRTDLNLNALVKTSRVKKDRFTFGDGLHISDVKGWAFLMHAFGFELPESEKVKKQFDIPTFNQDLYFNAVQVSGLAQYLNPTIYRHSRLFDDLPPLEKPQLLGQFFAYTMGVGKTIFALSLYGLMRSFLQKKKVGNKEVYEPFYGYKAEDGTVKYHDRPMLIVCPPLVIDQWIKDATSTFDSSWFTDLPWSLENQQGDYLIIEGKPEEREAKYKMLLEAWGRKNRGENIKLPKLVFIRSSTLSYGVGYKVEEGEEYGTLSDETMLTLLSGPSTFTIDGEEYTTETGVFGMLSVDEAGQFFSTGSTRRQFLERIAKRIGSDDNQGYVFFYNGSATNNSASDTIRIVRMLLHDEGTIPDTFFHTEQGLLKAGGPIRLLTSLFSVVQDKDLHLNVIANTEITEENTTTLKFPVPTEGNRIKEYHAHIGAVFLQLASAFLGLNNMSLRQTPKERELKVIAYDPQTKGKEEKILDVKEDLYKRYLPGFIQLLVDLQRGSINWRRMLEYGLLDGEDSKVFLYQPDTQNIARSTTLAIMDKNTAWAHGIAESLVEDEDLRRFFISAPFLKHHEGLRDKIKKLDAALKKPLPQDEEGIKRTKKERLEALKEVREELKKISPEISKLLDETIRYGLSAYEAEVPLPSSLKNELKDIVPNGKVKIRFPMGGKNIFTPDEESEGVGTGFMHEGTESELNMGERAKGGSERKVFGEARDELINLTFLLALMSNKEKNYRAYIEEEYVKRPDGVKFPIPKIKIVEETKDTTGKVVSRNVYDYDKFKSLNVSIGGEGETFSVGAAVSRISKGMDKLVQESILHTEGTWEAVEAAKKILGFDGEAGNNKAKVKSVSHKKGVLIFDSKKQVEALWEAVRRNDPYLPDWFKNAVRVGGVITGDTPEVERHKVIKNYRNATAPCLVIGTKETIGRGLNLTGDGVWVQLGYSFEKNIQALKRVLRISDVSLPKVVKVLFAMPEALDELLNLKAEINKLMTNERLASGSAISDESEYEEFMKLYLERTQRFAERFEKGAFTDKETEAITANLKKLAQALSRFKIKL